MRLQGPARRLTIFVGETDQWHHHASGRSSERLSNL